MSCQRNTQFVVHKQILQELNSIRNVITRLSFDYSTQLIFSLQCGTTFICSVIFVETYVSVLTVWCKQTATEEPRDVFVFILFFVQLSFVEVPPVPRVQKRQAEPCVNVHYRCFPLNRNLSTSCVKCIHVKRCGPHHYQEYELHCPGQ